MITQEERLDLTDKQVKAENLAYTIDIFKNFEVLAKGMSIKDFKAKTHCDYIENQRLQAQLDREIKINRKMKRALEKYANEKNWDSYGNNWKFGVYKDFENDDYPEYTDEKLAQQVLKEIENKE